MMTVERLPRELWPLMCRAASGEDWPPRTESGAQRLVDLAYQHRLLPLLTATHSGEGPLARVLERSRALSRANQFRVKTLISTLQRFSEIAGDDDFILFKGCDFAFRLYSDPELRPMVDIDILIPARAMRPFRERLETAGLIPYYPTPAMRIPGHHEFAFRGAGSTIELHQDFHQKPRHRIDYDAIWSRRQPLRAPVAASRLAGCDAILGLCIAIAGDQLESPLIRFVDLHLLLGEDPDALEQTAALARQWKCERAVYATLRRYTVLFPNSAPAVAEDVARSLLTPRTRVFIDRKILPPKAVPDGQRPARPVELWRKFWLMDDFQRRFAFLSWHIAATCRGLWQMLGERRTRQSAAHRSEKAR